LSTPKVADDYAYPCGDCTKARFPVDLYSIKIPGPWAVGVHVIDALASSETGAVVDSLNSDAVDPAPKQNMGVVGASIFRGMKQSYVVASSAVGGAAGATLTYGVPGASAGRHIVFDAPEQADGQSQVTAAAMGGRCVVTLTAGAGVAGHPAMFTVSAAADNCKVSADTDVAPGMPPAGGGIKPTGGGVGPTPGGGGAGSGGAAKSGNVIGSGCSLASSDGGPRALGLGFSLAAFAALLVRRARRASRGSRSRSS
jgi:hypothetical protein